MDGKIPFTEPVWGLIAQTEEAEKSEAWEQWKVTNNFRRSIAPIPRWAPSISRAHRVCSNHSLDPGVSLALLRAQPRRLGAQGRVRDRLHNLPAEEQEGQAK